MTLLDHPEVAGLADEATRALELVSETSELLSRVSQERDTFEKRAAALEIELARTQATAQELRERASTFQKQAAPTFEGPVLTQHLECLVERGFTTPEGLTKIASDIGHDPTILLGLVTRLARAIPPLSGAVGKGVTKTASAEAQQPSSLQKDASAPDEVDWSIMLRQGLA